MPPRVLRGRVLSFLRDNLLTIFTVIGVFSGVAFGVILRFSRAEKWSAREIMYVSFVGDIFLQMLKSLILPLIMSSIITAIGTLDLSMSGKIGARAIAYYFTTTVSAVILGIILSSAIHPGRDGKFDVQDKAPTRNVTTVDTLMDLVRNMFPPNLVQAAIAQYQTALVPLTEKEIVEAGLNGTGRNLTLYDWKITRKSEEQANLMGLVVFSVIMGITLSRMGGSGKPLLDFFCSLGAAMMIITNWVIWISPIGVFFLIAGKMLEMKNFEDLVGQLGMYFMTVMLGLFIHGFIILPLYFTLCTRKLPFRFIGNLSQALFTAFGTASSNATLPVSMRLLETKNGVDTRVSRFVMPIGATINMDGTALYEAIAAIFISEVRKVGLSLGQLISVSITATAASIGAAGIPQAGLVTMVMVLDTVGLPSEDVSIIIAIDWLLDRFRTTINVLGDSLGAGIVNHLSKRELEKMAAPAILDADKLDSQNGKISPEEDDK